MLSNLMGNALQHGSEAQPIVVTVDGSSVKHIRVSAANGGHVPADVLAHIFEPFRGVDDPGTTAGGLGLHIVERFITAHDGRVHAHSDPGTGTVLEFSVPRGRAAAHSGTCTA